MGKSKKRRGSLSRTLLSILCVVLTVILCALIFVTVFWEQKLGLINYAKESTLSSEDIQAILDATDPTDPDFTGPVVGADEIDFGNSGTVITSGENTLHILLIGQDRREGEGTQRSDAMILCTINKATKTVTLTSFLRDMYVKIPGYTGNKINASYAIGGMKLLDATLEANFGIQVDGNVEVDFNGFMDVIDLMGGVDIELTQQEATYLNNNGNWDVESNEHWKLTEGVNHLNGSQALAYSRIRKIGMDFERTERQRKVLAALFDNIKGMSLLELNNLLDQILPLITTDLTGAQITGYLVEYAPMLLDMNIVTQRVPADGTWYFAWVNGYDSIVVDFNENRDFLARTIGE